MNLHFMRSLEALKKDLLTMGALVEGSVQKAMSALYSRQLSELNEVVVHDDLIDKQEVEIEEDCLKILALYNPVAQDLRFVATVMKINNDLERMGDLAVSIARGASHLAQSTPIPIPPRLRRMASSVVALVQKSLTAFVDEDTSLAKRVLRQDDAIDRTHRSISKELTQLLADSPKDASKTLQLLWISKNLERIADHATNIAEDVVYMVEGDIIRHQKNYFHRRPKQAKNVLRFDS